MPVSSKRKDQSDQERKGPSVRLVEVTSDNEGQRLDNFLLALCKGVPKSHIYKSVRTGSVRVNRSRANVRQRLAAGDVVRVPPFRIPTSSQPAAPARTYPVIYEDDALLVIDKPAGVAVHGGSGVSFGVIESLRAAAGNRGYLELVHRLDRDTSGLLVLARRRSALVRMHEMWRADEVSKHYLALVRGRFPNDREHLRAPLLRWTTASGERRVRVDKEGQHAHTIVSCVQRYEAFSLLDAELLTGRTHQIRVHLASAGYPIIGDDKYGDEALDREFARQGFKRMFLHASRLKFEHPLTGKVLDLHASLPQVCDHALDLVDKGKITL